MRWLSSLVLLMTLTTQLCVAAELSAVDAAWVGRRIWRNESGGRVSGLTHWNQGEAFPSLGIGHFLWYPTGRRGPFVESFPGLLRLLKAEGVALPSWLDTKTPCPWPSRTAFMAAFDGPRLTQLRELLARTVPHQTRYILRRQQAALPTLLEAVPDAAVRRRLRHLFNQLATTPAGIFALADYTNFKGEGVAPRERHAGQGWGLLQVLEELAEVAAKNPQVCLVGGFADAAGTVLRRRVANDPSGKERRWLKGWLRRVAEYRQPRRPGATPPCGT